MIQMTVMSPEPHTIPIISHESLSVHGLLHEWMDQEQEGFHAFLWGDGAVRVPWTEESIRLQSMGLQRVRHY